MAHLEDRWYRTVVTDGRKVQVPKVDCGKGLRYRVRYIAPDGREKSASYPDRKKREALAFLADVQSSITRGTYIDPEAGRVTLKTYGTEWLASATTDEATKVRLEYEFRLHVYPFLGGMALTAVQPSTIRSWAHGLKEAGLSVGYRRILFNDVSMVFNAAVDDRKVVSNPFAAKTVRPPREESSKVVPWTTAVRAAFRARVPDRYRITVDLGAGCGLRQGEIFAISPNDIDADRPVLHVTRQIKLVSGKLFFALPKGRKKRDVPLPESVAQRLAEHVKKYPPVDVTLPWGSSTGELTTVRLYLTTPDGRPLSRDKFNAPIWKRAIRDAGIEDTRRNGMHILRHTYASVLLDAGESIKALAGYLGHTDPGFTLRVYTHLMPASEDRTRNAIDQAFRDDLETSDGLTTA
jgi:integrase